MQSIASKITVAVITYVFFSTQASYNQGVTSKLDQADSLFDSKKYTESFELYQSILIEGQATPGMLLKMAFIKEGLGSYSQALYYLNIYYLKTANKRVLTKMGELAKEHNLEGYQYSDLEFFKTLLLKYYNFYLAVIGFIIIGLLALLIFQKRKQKPVTAIGIGMVLTLALMFYMINFATWTSKGILVSDDTYIMNAPASGAELVAIVNDGHRVPVLGKTDVWYKIEWDGEPAYIREGNLLLIR